MQFLSEGGKANCISGISVFQYPVVLSIHVHSRKWMINDSKSLSLVFRVLCLSCAIYCLLTSGDRMKL